LIHSPATVSITKLWSLYWKNKTRFLITTQPLKLAERCITKTQIRDKKKELNQVTTYVIGYANTPWLQRTAIKLTRASTTISLIISDSPVHCDLVESKRRGFHQPAKKQEDQHKHAKVPNLKPVFLLQKMHPNVINMEHKFHN
jgi:hypothetical protein